MILSGVGTIGIYNYNTWTGVLSSKDGTEEAFVADAFDKKKRTLQKQQEEKELEERRKQKERMKEALEAYAKYRRELRHYYNELGYQKKLAASMEGMAVFVDVKKPSIVSGLFEMMMMLGV